MVDLESTDMVRVLRVSFIYVVLLVTISLILTVCTASESQDTQPDTVVLIIETPSLTVAAVSPAPTEENLSLKAKPNPTRTEEPFFDNLPSGLLAVALSEGGLVFINLNGDVVGEIPQYWDEAASISPDGKILVVRCTGIDCLLKVNLNDMSEVVLAENSGLLFGRGSWSSDNSILYIEAEEELQESGEDWGSIFRVDMQSGDTFKVTHWWTAEIAPAVSPDRKWLAYSANFHHDFPGEHDLYLYNLSCDDDPEACFQMSKRLTFLSPDGHATSPSWNPTSQRIVYVCRDGSIFGICIMDLDSGSSEQIYTSSIELRDPYWSPDGNWILFRVLHIFDDQLIVIHPDGMNEIVISDEGPMQPIGWILKE